MKPKTRILNLTWGADPELAVFDRQRNKMVSAIPVLNHDKDNPIMLDATTKFYHDNILSELAFAPSKSPAEMVESFRRVLTKASAKLGKRYKLVPKAAHEFDEEALSDPRAKESGCSPTFNVYRREQNPAVVFKDGDGQRNCGGHVHIGNANADTDTEGLLMTLDSKELAAKVLDVYLGTSSVIFDRDPASIKRRSACEAGQVRFPSYGLEHRMLGNWYLRSPVTTRLVYDLADYAMQHIRNGTAEEVMSHIDENELQHAINANDVSLVRSILKKAKMPTDLVNRVEKDYQLDESLAAWGIE